MSSKAKAVFLDRDGVIIRDPGHLHRVDQIRILSGVESLAKLQDEGILLIIFSNQSAVARGMLTENEMWGIDSHLRKSLEEKGVKIADSFYCIHHPEFTGHCECRKSKSGLVKKAIEDHNIDPGQSIVIGDKISDLEAARRAGIEFGVLVKRNGKGWNATVGKESLSKTKLKADNNISQAVGLIMKNLK